MKAFVGLLNTLIISSWIMAIAIFSIQNIQTVSVKFLTFESITLPVGVLLAFCGVVGLIIGWFLPLLFAKRKNKAVRS